MRNKNSLPLLATALLAFGTLAGCAKQGYPSGGPIDRTPPKVLASTPASGTNNFASNEFVLQMDEYVTIKDADNNVLISPPLQKKPEYTVRGRNVIVRLQDTLLENTTYLFQFKGAVVDFNEGNPLPSFEYVFSTGTVIDSMTLRGRVVDALTLKSPKETVSVLAYAEGTPDSAAALEQPRYFTRCDTSGHFAFNHIAAGRYWLLALVDGDRNMRLNASEAMAFLDSAVTALRMPRPKDTTAVDTTLADSAARYAYMKPDSIPSHSMRLSLLVSEAQRITGSKALSAGHFQIVTKQPLSNNYRLRHLMDDSTLHLYTRLNTLRDTLDLWTSRDGVDSLVLLLTDTLLDDTLSLRFNTSRTANRKSVAPNPLRLQSLVTQNHPFFDTLRLRLNIPVGACDTAAVVRVMDMKDSSERQCKVRLLGLTEAMIDFAGEAGAKYQIFLPAALFTDIYGNKSDSLAITTTYTKPENYGSITLSVDSHRASDDSQLLVQLLNEKGDLVRQEILTAPAAATFPHLKAGKYTFRLVDDRDGDGQWTPGDFWQHRQPEEVIYFGKVLDLRENWEITEKFRW